MNDQISPNEKSFWKKLRESSAKTLSAENKSGRIIKRRAKRMTSAFRMVEACLRITGIFSSLSKKNVDVIPRLVKNVYVIYTRNRISEAIFWKI
jgi:hypothetical protein